jgi:F-type H+-transporting ATPase subunit gamma
MQTLESMRRRIESAEDLHAVVRVMKALAAVSIRQYEKAATSLVAYSRTISLGLQVVLRNRPEEMHGTEAKSTGRWGIIVFGSDQGMCGSFNEQVTTFALEHMKALPGRLETCTVLAVGMRIVGRLEDAGASINERFPVPSSLAGITPVVHDLLLKIEELRFQGGIDRFLLVHHSPLSGATSQPRKLQLLPVDPDWLRNLGQREWPSRSLPTFTMDWRRLFSALIREHLFVTLYRAFAESLSSENASRLASMQAAEKNIEDHLARLTARYHQERQQSITEELLDIVAGFETLTKEEGQTGGFS